MVMQVLHWQGAGKIAKSKRNEIIWVEMEKAVDQRSTAFYWCPREDSNFHTLAGART